MKRYQSSLLATCFIVLALGFLLLATGGCARHGTVTGDARSIYQQGERFYERQRFARAIEIYQQVQNEYPESEYARLALLRVGDSHYRKNELDEAGTNYNDFLKFNADHPQAAYAYYQLGMTHYVRLKTIDRDLAPLREALATFQEALKKFPASPPYTAKIIQRINDCKRRFAKREFYVGLFYFKQQRYGPAAGRFNYLLATYPGFIDDKALYYLGLAQLNQGKKEDAQKAFLTLTSGYPRSSYAPEARMLMSEEEGPGVKLSFLVRDYFLDKQDDAKDRYLTTTFTPAGYSPRLAGLFLSPRDKESGPPPAVVTFESLFRERQMHDATAVGAASQKTIPDWNAGRDRTAASPPQPQSVGWQTTTEQPTTAGQRQNTARQAAPTADGGRQTTGQTQQQAEVRNLREPLEIISDWTEANRQQGTITFGGKVIAKQRDMVLYADQVTNYFDLETRELLRAVATGNVKLSQADKFATCEQATLEQARRTVMLEGNAVMWQGNNRVTGERILIYLNSNQAEVFGSEQQKARVKIIPGQEMQ
ncbi:MAG: outer membrane protein assembly factor BamD [Deltaproteobacteria bacterium]|nr:outer membrane protein assembly factor BamD [Candidatus Anaeroferrophillus wilburensis]MBN2889226.1 outer membrane protein assembly factor BamD [Deltaproteobacteria bacterium]